MLHIDLVTSNATKPNYDRMHTYMPATRADSLHAIKLIIIKLYITDKCAAKDIQIKKHFQFKHVK